MTDAQIAKHSSIDPPNATTRVDLLLIAGMVEPGARVLDIGCGDGALLRLLADQRGVDARGMELSQRGVNDCVAKGLSVIQGDADADLDSYPDRSFDYVILSQTLQATRAPRRVLDNMLRIGAKAIVSFPNFGHWRSRLDLLVNGRMPLTENMPVPWYDTPNIHFCTIRDFVELAQDVGAHVDQTIVLDASGKRLPFSLPWIVWNVLGAQAVFLLSRDGRQS